MTGEPTGHHYEDGSPVRIGDRITLRDIPVPATVRVRPNNKSGAPYYYATYSVKNRTYTCGLPKIAEYGFRPWSPPRKKGWLELQMEKEGKTFSGRVIIGLEDYDTAIYR